MEGLPSLGPRKSPRRTGCGCGAAVLLLEEEGWEPQLPVSEAPAKEQPPLPQPGAPPCTFHGIQRQAGAPK